MEPTTETSSTELKAFPTAEGYGRLATGGRGSRVIEVTNLNDSGPGSFREAVEASGPRTVVFRVGGMIRLESSIKVKIERYLAGLCLASGGKSRLILFLTFCAAHKKLEIKIRLRHRLQT